MELTGSFCDGYRAHPDIADYIASPGADPNAKFHDFEGRYRNWLKPVDEGGAGGDGSIPVMSFFFQSPSDSREALEMGVSADEGRVQQDDCGKFVNFVTEAEASFGKVLDLLYGDPAAEIPKENPADQYFQDAVRAFVMGAELTDHLRGLLNGACFLRNEFVRTSISGPDVADSATATTPEFYAISGYEMHARFKRDLGDPYWRDILDALQQTVEAAGDPMINLDLALQLRLGKRDEPLPYPPHSIGNGIIIFGAG